MVTGPAWTRGEIEKPAGRKSMGSWTAAVVTSAFEYVLPQSDDGSGVQASVKVYTEEQQARLGCPAALTNVALSDAACVAPVCLLYLRQHRLLRASLKLLPCRHRISRIPLHICICICICICSMT